MPTNVTFTDNNRMANSFVKELYIGSKWKGYPTTDRMIIDQARDASFQPTGSLISLGLESTFDTVTGMADGFLAVNNDTSGPIKFDPKGKFKGMDCYMVVDWSAFSLPASQTDLIDGVICFWAEIDMEKATNIDNSPTIKRYLYEQRMLNLTPEDVPECKFDMEEWTPISSNVSVDVYDETELASAIMSNSAVTVNLKANIDLHGSNITNYNVDGTIKELVSINNKQVIINGNGFKIFDYSQPISGATLQDGKYSVPYPYEVTGTETFTTIDGELLTLAKSNIYRAGGWVVISQSQKKYALLLPTELSNLYQRDIDNVFVCFRVSFTRHMYKVTSASMGILFFTVTDENDYDTISANLRSKTPNTDFFLVNYAGDNDGVVIKNGRLYYSASYPNISQCKAQFIIRAKNGARLEINNLYAIGGMDNCIRNDNNTDMKISGCEVTNPAKSGVSNYGNLFVRNSTFHDIKGCAVRTDMTREQIPNHKPYMEVTGCTFRDIGHYGTNMAAVWNSGKAYIADNEFINTNYCAVKVGGNGVYPSVEWRRSLVEHNLIHYTPEWIEKRKGLGLQDSGDIYVVGNNEMAIIRFNRIIGAGGLGDSSPNRKNDGIYVDYWAYNVQIYGNVITGTENYYDIDCRDCSPEERDKIPDILASGEYSTTNIYIGYNVCDGYLRIQENTVDVADTTNDLDNSGCNFINNFVLNKTIEPEMENNVLTGNTYMGVVFCKDSDGIITDETGMVASATLIRLLENCPILPEDNGD